MKTIAAFAFLTAVSAKSLLERATDGVDDTVVLNYALTLEHLENAFYSGGLEQFDDKAFTDAGLPASARPLYVQIAAHEQDHVDFLSKALGANATKPCTYEFGYKTPKEFAAISQILEGVGVSAYSGAAKFITNPDYLTAAAVILSTEARHASWIADTVNGVQPWSGPLDVPLTFDQVYSLASAFITSCPSSNPTLPVKAFPAVAFSPATAKPGDEVTLTADGLKDGMTAVFLTGLSPVTADIKDSKVTIPKDLNGTVYMVVTEGGAAISDDTTKAGPAVFQFQATVVSETSANGTTTSPQSAAKTTTSSTTSGALELSVSMVVALWVPMTAALMVMFA